MSALLFIESEDREGVCKGDSCESAAMSSQVRRIVVAIRPERPERDHPFAYFMLGMAAFLRQNL